MSFNADEFESEIDKTDDTEEVSSTERRPPDRNRERIWIRNAVIEDIREEQGTFYVTIRYRDQDWDWDGGPGRGPDGFPGRGPDGFPGRGPDGFPGRGPGRGQDRNQMQRVRLVVNRQTRIVNQNGRDVQPRRLRTGMRIDALISAAMTRSIPPQARAFQILIDEQPERSMVTTGRIIQVDVRGQFIIIMTEGQFTNFVRFNVGPNTVIFGPGGRQIGLQNLFPGMRVRVEHSLATTSSIPPQSAAFVIRVI